MGLISQIPLLIAYDAAYQVPLPGTNIFPGIFYPFGKSKFPRKILSGGDKIFLGIFYPYSPITLLGGMILLEHRNKIEKNINEYFY